MRSPTSKLTPPLGQRDHMIGPSQASLILVEYGDYECPHCGAAYPLVKEIREGLGDRLQFAYRHFPLTEIHPHAELAAETAEAAGAQGKFWQMHDLLFENQQLLNERNVFRFAETLGLDMQRFKLDLQEHAYQARVREDFMSGVRSGVNGTPTFFINGLRYDEPWQNLLIELTERANVTD